MLCMRSSTGILQASGKKLLIQDNYSERIMKEEDE